MVSADDSRSEEDAADCLPASPVQLTLSVITLLSSLLIRDVSIGCAAAAVFVVDVDVH